MKTESGIYCILNTQNGKKYIGQTVNLKKRKQNHWQELKENKHHNDYLQNAFNKYGEENFDFLILLKCSEDNLDYWERYFISDLNTTDDKYGYNLDSGGNLNKRHHQKTIEKMISCH